MQRDLHRLLLLPRKLYHHHHFLLLRLHLHRRRRHHHLYPLPSLRARRSHLRPRASKWTTCIQRTPTTQQRAVYRSYSAEARRTMPSAIHGCEEDNGGLRPRAMFLPTTCSQAVTHRETDAAQHERKKEKKRKNPAWRGVAFCFLFQISDTPFYPITFSKKNGGEAKKWLGWVGDGSICVPF